MESAIGVPEVSERNDGTYSFLKKINGKYAVMSFTDRTIQIGPNGMGISEQDLGWLTGFTEADGCFTVQRRKSKSQGYGYIPVYATTLRYDDLSMLDKIRELFGCGYFYLRDGVGQKSAQIVYQIHNLYDVMTRVIPVFDCCAFYGRKEREYPLWREMAYTSSKWYRKRATNRPDEVNDRLDHIFYELQGIKDQAIAGELEPHNRALLEQAVSTRNGLRGPYQGHFFKGHSEGLG